MLFTARGRDGLLIMPRPLSGWQIKAEIKGFLLRYCLLVPMELKEKITKICRVRNVIIFCLISLFLWWGSGAVLKYWSQPLSTDLHFEYGETNLGIQFPLITLCQSNVYVENPIINECNDGSWNFISIIVSCMKGNKSFKVTKVN